MKTTQKSMIFALGASVLALTSCATAGQTGGDNSTVEESTSLDISVLPESSSSEESLPDITIPDGTLSYLKGKFFGGGGALSIDEGALKWEGDVSLSLKPTKVGKMMVGSFADNTLKDVIAVYFDADYNNGDTYCAYVDTVDDGFLHLAKKEGRKYETIATFQPDISKYAGTYSYYGDGSASNYYEIIDPEFDVERGVYPMARYYPNWSSWSDEQSWHILARVRIGSDNLPYYTVEFYDSDDYGYGEESLVLGESGIELYNVEYDTTECYIDAGAFNCLSLFDEKAGESVSTTVDVAEKTISFGEKSGTYEVAYDDKGMYLKVTFGEEEASLRLRDRHLLYETASGTTVYPIDDLSPLEGTFTDAANTISCEMDWDTWDYVLKWNGDAVTYTSVVENNRKSLAFEADGASYIVSPDKASSSVRVKKGDNVSYYINAERYDALFKHSFIAHDKSSDFTLAIADDFSCTMAGKSGKASYSYWHGDKFPSLVLSGDIGSKTLNLVQEDIGLFSLKDGDEAVTLYSKTILDQVYGTYSSNGKDSFVLSETSITYEGKTYEYEFAPSYQSGLGYYYFGIASSLGNFESNLAGCFYSDEMSFVKKDIFAKIAGTYSLYGSYGIENIKISEGGDLALDTVNEAGDGLDKDVPYTYQIITTGGDDIAVIGFLYKGYTIFIYVYEDHVTLTGLDYYRSSIVESWGVYLDESGSNILYVNDGSLYLNGSELTISSRSEGDSGLTYVTNEGTITFKDGSATITSGDSVISLSREFSYADYAKFVGDYTANDTSVSFAKTTTSYEVTIGDGDPIDLSDTKFVLRDGKVAIEISYFGSKYYLVIDATTGEVICEYEASSIPPAPPLPPSL